MSDTVVTLRPDSTTTVGAGVAHGGATLDAVLSDNNDASYVDGNYGTLSLVTCATATIPAGALIRGAQIRARARDISASNDYVNVDLHDGISGFIESGGIAVPAGYLTPSLVTYTGDFLTATPDGSPWSQAIIDALGIRFAIGATTGELVELYLDIFYNQISICAITSVGASDSLQPTVNWSYSDPEGDGQTKFRMKVFTASQADPDSPSIGATYDSGDVTSSAHTDTCTTILSYGTTYYIYVKTTDSGSGNWSDWTGTTFTPTNVPPTCAITSISPTSSVSPTVSWSYSDAEGDPQSQYQVKAFTTPQVDPNAGGATWDSGATGSSVHSATVGVTLAHNTTYYFYVRVSDIYGFGAWSSGVTFSSPDTAPSCIITSIGPNTSLSPTVTFTYSDPEGDPQAGYQCKVFTVAQTNPDSPTISPTWDSGDVSSTATSFSIGTTLTALTQYYVYLRVRDASSGSGSFGTYTSSTFISNRAPSVTSVSVSPASSSQPTVSWTYSDPDGDTQAEYEVAIFTTAQSNPSSPTSLPVWDSGNVVSAATSVVVEVPLVNQTLYYVYVRVSDASAFGPWSSPATVTIAFDPMGVPIISVPYVSAARAEVDNLNVQGRANLLAKDTANLEGGVGAWVMGSNCSVARSTAHAFRGSASLAMTAAAGGDMWATTGNPGVAGGQLLTALVTVRPDSTARTCQVFLRFYNSSGVFLSQVTAGGDEATSVWLRLWVSAHAPAAATTANVVIKILGASSGEIHNVDSIALPLSTVNPLDNSDLNDLGYGWNLQTGGGSNTADVVPTGGAYGTSSIRLRRFTAADAPYATTTYRLACQPGERLILSAALLVNTAIAQTGDATQACLRLDWLDGTMTDHLISDLTPADDYVDADGNNTFARRFTIVTVPSGKTAFRPIIFAGHPSNAGTVDLGIDGVQIQRVDNGLTNGGLETAILGGDSARDDHFDGVGWYTESYPGLTATDTSVTHTGARSLRLGGPAGSVAIGTWHIVDQDTYVAGASTIDVGYWWRLSNVRASHVKLQFFDAAYQLVTLSSLGGTLPAGALNINDTIFIPGGVDASSDTGWSHKTFNGISVPAGAVWVKLMLLGGWSLDGINPGYTWIDDVSVTVTGSVVAAEYTPGGWTGGGLAGTQYVYLQRSADHGLTWQNVRINDIIYPNGVPITGVPYRLGAIDHLAPVGKPVRYRAFARGLDSGASVTSDAWEYPQDIMQVLERYTWLKDPVDSSRNHRFYTRPPGVVPNAIERQQAKYPLGRSDTVVLADVIQLEDITVTICCLTDDDFDALTLLRSGQRVLLVQTWLNRQWYVRLGASAPATAIDSAPVRDVSITGFGSLEPS